MKPIKKDEFNYAVGELDISLVEEALEYEEKLKKRKRMFASFGSIAAVLCITAMCMFSFFSNGGSLSDRDLATENGNVYVGPTHKVDGIETDNSGSYSIAAPKFCWQQTVEVRLTEILSGTYCYPGTVTPYKIAKLELISELHSKGMPKEIYLRCCEKESGLLEGYDRFIISVCQIGIDDYVMINQSNNTLEYFPHMFEVTMGLGYGNVIAFDNNRVSGKYLERAAEIDKLSPSSFDEMRRFDADYPVRTDNDTLDEIKQNIIDYCEKHKGTLEEYTYKTEEDIFCTEEARELLAYLKAEGSVFAQSVSDGITYTRVVSGFISEEVIIINVKKDGKTEITRSGASYTAEELKSFPDIASVIENKELDPKSPPHLTYKGEMKFRKSTVVGYCRKIDGKVCGIVSSMWVYELGDGFTYDTEYEVYDGDGNVRIIEADVLEEKIENSSFVRIPMKAGEAMSIAY